MERIIRASNSSIFEEKGCEKEEYTYTLEREGHPPAERCLQDKVCGR